MDDFEIVIPVAKVENRHGIVIGKAIVCTEYDEPYFDSQDDWIPEASMFDAVVDFAASAREAREQHARKNAGTVPLLFPLTKDISSELDIQADWTGLAIGMKPDAEMLAKFESGELTGFSIGGKRLEDEEVVAKSAMSQGGKKKRIMRKFRINEISGVDVPAQAGARALIMKRHARAASGLEPQDDVSKDLVQLATGATNGHQHGIRVRRYSDGEIDIYCAYAMGEDGDSSHNHGIVVTDGGYSVLENAGHTHSLDSATLAAVITACALSKREDEPEEEEMTPEETGGSVLYVPGRNKQCPFPRRVQGNSKLENTGAKVRLNRNRKIGPGVVACRSAGIGRYDYAQIGFREKPNNLVAVREGYEIVKQAVRIATSSKQQPCRVGRCRIDIVLTEAQETRVCLDVELIGLLRTASRKDGLNISGAAIRDAKLWSTRNEDTGRV